MSNKKLWLWLSLHFGAGTDIYKKLYEHFGSIEKIYDCDDADVNLISWLHSHQKRKLLDKNLNHAEEVLEWCSYHYVKITTPSENDYPMPLRNMDDYPAALYYRGKMPDFEKTLCISVVGTRNCTNEGQKNAYCLGFGLASAGALVVSGMALGIDCVSQKGALYAGGSAVAVLGSGIDVVYPKANAKLMEKIAQVGVVMTEYPPQTPPNGYNFPIRNRIISALSVATVVVEGDTNSGALITARKSLEQGKDLYAYPGPVNSFASSGTNLLLREGARVATEAIDVLEQYMDKYPYIDLAASKLKPVLPRENRFADYYAGKSDSPKEAEVVVKTTKSNRTIAAEIMKGEMVKFDTSVLTEKEKIVYDAIEFNTPTCLDSIADIDMEFSEIVSTMTMLELKKAVVSMPGGYFLKK